MPNRPAPPFRARVTARLAAGVVAALAVAAVVPACGSGEVTLDEWVVQADATCRAAQTALDDDPPPAANLPGEPLRATAAAVRTESAALKELPDSTEKRTAVEDYLLALDHRADVLELYATDLDATPASDPAPPIDDLAAITEEAATRAAALGLVDCGAGVDLGVGPEPTLPPPSAPTSLPSQTSTTLGSQISEFETEDQEG